MRDVLVLYNHELFVSGIVRLLKERGFSPVAVETHDKDALQQALAMRPWLVLVEDDDTDHAFAAKLTGLLRTNPEVGVIRIRIQSNRLNIYTSKQVMASGPKELFEAIDNLARGHDEQSPVNLPEEGHCACQR